MGKDIGGQGTQYFAQVPKYKSVMQKTADMKKINKFRYSRMLDDKLLTATKYVVKFFGAILLTVFMFVVIYYSTVEFLNMKYGGSYEEIKVKLISGAQKYRAIPNVTEQVKIKAEREMIFNRIYNAIEHLD